MAQKGPKGPKSHVVGCSFKRESLQKPLRCVQFLYSVHEVRVPVSGQNMCLSTAEIYIHMFEGWPKQLLYVVVIFDVTSCDLIIEADRDSIILLRMKGCLSTFKILFQASSLQSKHLLFQNFKEHMYCISTRYPFHKCLTHLPKTHQDEPLTNYWWFTPFGDVLLTLKQVKVMSKPSSIRIEISYTHIIHGTRIFKDVYLHENPLKKHSINVGEYTSLMVWVQKIYKVMILKMPMDPTPEMVENVHPCRTEKTRCKHDLQKIQQKSYKDLSFSKSSVLGKFVICLVSFCSFLSIFSGLQICQISNHRLPSINCPVLQAITAYPIDQKEPSF